jgi:hypothetical protein
MTPENPIRSPSRLGFWIVTIACVLATGGCVTTSQVGPFVKHVQRNGDFLVVHKCIIVLENDEISERACTVEQVPLRSVPMMPQGAQPVMPQSGPVPVMPQAGQPPRR